MGRNRTAPLIFMTPNYDMRHIYTIIAGLISLSIGIVAALYWPGLSGPLLLDDRPNLIPAQIDQFALNDLRAAALSNGSSLLGRPISALTFGMNSAASGMDTWMLKATNLALHIIVALLLFWFIGLLLEQFSEQNHSSKKISWFFAAAVTWIWSIHPLQVSTVLYIVQRMTILSALFSLAALITFLKARHALCSNKRSGSILLWTATPIFIILAILSKENGILVLPIIILIETLIIKKQDSAPRPVRLFLALIVLGPLVLACGYIVTHLQTIFGDYAYRPFTLSQRLLTESTALAFYLHLILLPDPGMMSLFHDDFPIVRAADMTVLFSVALHLIGIMTAITLRRRQPIIALGIIWFYVWHLLESTIIPLELVYEHRNYLASAGLFIAILDILRQTARSVASSKALVFFLCGFVLLCGFQTWNRSSIWGNEELFTVSTVNQQPQSPRAQVQAINILMRTGDMESTRAGVRRLIEIAPDEAGPWIQLVFTYCTEHQLPSDILEATKTALSNERITPFTLETMKAIQDAYFNGKCPAAPIETLLELTERLVSHEKNPYPFQSHYLHARFLAETNQINTTRLHFRAAFETAMPLASRIVALLSLANFEIDKNLYEEAHATVNELRNLSRNPALRIDEPVAILELELAYRLDRSGLIVK